MRRMALFPSLDKAVSGPSLPFYPKKSAKNFAFQPFCITFAENRANDNIRVYRKVQKQDALGQSAGNGRRDCRFAYWLQIRD
jgi:hypothetical protein